MVKIGKAITFLLVCSGFWIPQKGLGQFNLGFHESDALRFSDDSLLRLATVGGFDNAQFSEIHLNGDTRSDLFVFDRANDTWRTFVYNAATDRYDHAPEYERLFPGELEDLVLLRDYNCDGSADIFCYHQGGLRVFRNTGSTPPAFVLASSMLQSQYGSIVTSMPVLPGDVPAIVDVDGDGDLDILSFGIVNSENTIEFHENQSIDLYGHCDSLVFNVATQCWGNVEEPQNSSELVETTCKGIVAPGAGRDERLHPGSSLLLIDTDNDGDKDLVVGDIQTDVLVHAINAGDAQSATIDVNQQSTLFPNSLDPAKMQYLVAGYELDADHDGRPDLVLTVNNNIDSSCNTQHQWLYRNLSSGAPLYSLQTKSFLLEEMVDLGSNACPVAMDVDGDGLRDLLIATDYRRSPFGATGSRLHYFRNTGSAAQPDFTEVNGNFASWSLFNFQGASPALGDMDNDGDLDMVVGVADGSLHYFRNDPLGSTANFVLTQPQYMGINSIGSDAAPEIADLNGDDLPDLIVGERTGAVSYFENTGTLTSASFASTPTIANLGDIDVSFFCCRGNAVPRFVDNPAFGPDRYLFIGSGEKQVKIYRVSTDLNTTFDKIDSIEVNAGQLVPVIADFNQDGIYDLLTGTAEGGVKYFTRDANYPVGVQEPQAGIPLTFNLYPNPAHDLLNISFPHTISGNIYLTDITGRTVKELHPHQNKLVCIDVSKLPPGSYFIRCSTGSANGVKPVIILR